MTDTAITNEIRDFLQSGKRNCWIESGDLSVFVRRGFHLIDHEIKNCFDIANINVDAEKRGQGIFTKWLSIAEAEAAQSGLAIIYIENLLNERLQHSLCGLGYLEVTKTFPVIMYKKLRF